MDIASHFAKFSEDWSATVVDGVCEDWERLQKCESEVRSAYSQPTADQAEWLLQNIGDGDKSLFVSLALEGANSLDERFFPALLAAGVNEVDPSGNKRFIQPAVQHFGVRRVMEHLLEVVKTGSPFQQAGAINALYWAQVPLTFKGDTKEFTLENATPESREKYLSVVDVSREIAINLLQLFVSTESVDVQRSIIPRLTLENPEAYPESHQQLVQQAVDIARTHDDDYIRHRVEVQLGNESLLQPLPHRASSPDRAS